MNGGSYSYEATQKHSNTGTHRLRLLEGSVTPLKAQGLCCWFLFTIKIGFSFYELHQLYVRIKMAFASMSFINIITTTIVIIIIYQGRFRRPAYHHLQGLGRTQWWFLGLFLVSISATLVEMKMIFKHTAWSKRRESLYIFTTHPPSRPSIYFTSTQSWHCCKLC